MNDPLKRLRADADAEENAGESSDLLGQSSSAAIDRLLDAYFAEQPPGEAYVAAIEALSESAATEGVPAQAQRRPNLSPRPASSTTVEGTLGLGGRQARSAIAATLGLNPDAADRLLELPAAALLGYPAAAVAGLAVICGRSRGEILKAVADSSKSSGGYVYAYRPGGPSTEPAQRPEDDRDRVANLVEWGRQLFGAGDPRG